MKVCWLIFSKFRKFLWNTDDQSCEPYAFIFPEICMHVCTKKLSKYAAICNYFFNYASICIYFKAILENNYTKFNNPISRKTKTIIWYINFVHLQYYQSINHIIKKINLFKKLQIFFRKYHIFHIFIKIFTILSVFRVL